MPTILPSVAAHVMVTGSLSASEEQDTRNAGKSEREEGVRKGEKKGGGGRERGEEKRGEREKGGKGRREGGKEEGKEGKN